MPFVPNDVSRNETLHQKLPVQRVWRGSIDALFLRGKTEWWFEYLHEVSLRKVDAEILPDQKSNREPCEESHDEDVLDEALPESGGIERSAVGGRARLPRRIVHGCRYYE